MPKSLPRMQSTLDFQSNGQGYGYKRLITNPMQWLQKQFEKVCIQARLHSQYELFFQLCVGC